MTVCSRRRPIDGSGKAAAAFAHPSTVATQVFDHGPTSPVVFAHRAQYTTRIGSRIAASFTLIGLRVYDRRYFGHPPDSCAGCLGIGASGETNSKNNSNRTAPSALACPPARKFSRNRSTCVGSHIPSALVERMKCRSGAVSGHRARFDPLRSLADADQYLVRSRDVFIQPNQVAVLRHDSLGFFAGRILPHRHLHAAGDAMPSLRQRTSRNSLTACSMICASSTVRA